MTVISLVQSNIVRSRSSVYKREISQKNKVRSFLAVLLILFIVAIIFFYVLQINSIAAKGYKIRGLKNQLNELKDINKVLQVNISNLKSINVLQSKTESFNMIEAKNIEYVNISPTNVVVAK